MRTLLLASAAALALGGAVYAQNAPGNPQSTQASNISRTDTHSLVAPALPVPGATGTPEDYLQRAERAVRAGRTGEAQEALERAETRLLDRSVSGPAAANQPDNGPRIDAINRALHALANHDRTGTMSNIQAAMNAPATGNQGMGNMQMGTQGAAMGNMGSMNSSATPMNSAGTMAPMQPMGGIGQGAPPNGGTAAANTAIYNSCGVPPCVQGTPPAAPGGGSGIGPAALRTAPMDSPVATGAGENGAKSSGGNNTGGNGTQ